MKKKLCKSCSGPLDEFSKEEIIMEGFCPHCVDKKGEVKSYGEVLKGMIEYIQAEHKEIEEKHQLSKAQEWLREGEVWKEKFLDEELVIDVIRKGHLREIFKNNQNYKHNCLKCMYYQDEDYDLDKKSKWLDKVNDKYGSCANVIYWKGELVGFAQYAPKSEFPKLKKLDGKNYDPKQWYISCLFITDRNENLNGEDRKNLAVKLLNYVIELLIERGVESVEISPAIKSETLSSTIYNWSFYKKLGFEEVSRGKEFVVANIEFEN